MSFPIWLTSLASPTLAENHAQLLLAMGEFMLTRWLETEDSPQDDARGAVQKPDGRLEHRIEQPQRTRHPKRGFRRFADGERLRRQLAQHDVEKCDRRERERHAHGADRTGGYNARHEEERLKHSRQERLAHPAEGKAGERDAELRRGKIRIQMRGHMPRKCRARFALLLERFELASAHLHDRKLRGDEKAIEQDEEKNRARLQEHHSGGIPVRRHSIRSGKEQWRDGVVHKKKRVAGP